MSAPKIRCRRVSHAWAFLLASSVCSLCLAQNDVTESSTGAESDAPCTGIATFLLLGVNKEAKYEIDLRQGSSPGSVKLHGVSTTGESLVSFKGLCAGNYFFAYRSKGAKDFSVSGRMQINRAGEQIQTVLTRVRFYNSHVCQKFCV
jgi:hypothetical protein